MKKQNVLLITFSVMSFVLAMVAFIFNGILDKVAVSMDISVANTGLLNTMYAYGAAFGVPVTLILFRKIERSKMLKFMLFLTVLMTLLIVIAQNFIQLLLIRLVMGVSANSYGVLAIATVVSLAPAGRQGRSLAYYIMGSSLALAIGIPLTRILSATLDWRAMFGILAVLMMASLICFAMKLPKNKLELSEVDLKKELSHFKNKNILGLFSTALIMFVGYGAFYTYVTPYLLTIFPETENIMSYVLVAIGVSSFIGNLLGGQFADRIGYVKTMFVGAVIQISSIMAVTVSSHNQWLTIIAIVTWIMGAWLTGLQFNNGVAEETKNSSSLMLSLVGTANQLGMAVGSNMAAVTINLNGIENIVYLTLVTGFVFSLIQFRSLKNSESVLAQNK